MRPKKIPPKEFELAKGFTVEKCLEHLDKKEREPLVNLIHTRFTERFLAQLPIKPAENKSGFVMMAIGCLMIESLQAFRKGDEETKGHHDECFRDFFREVEALNPLYPYAGDFYKNVRCGILHQAETTGGWRIRRDSGALLFDPETAVINANLFLKALTDYLDKYCDDLKKAEWGKELWKPVEKKLRHICAHCGTGYVTR
jgi:hypothetical protein